MAALHEQGIKPPFDRWYVIRAEQFQRTLGSRELAASTESDVTAFLADLGRWRDLEGWQLRQVVDSLEILLVRVLGLSWASHFDWAFWRDSARRLEPGHPTIARESDLGQERMPRLVASGRRPLRAAVTAEIRRRAYSVRTERTYLQWIRRFVVAFANRDPKTLGAKEVRAFLEDLVVRGNVAPSTQNQARSALVFLYREVLCIPLELGEFVRPKRPRSLPVVLTREEVRALLGELTGSRHLMASLPYGTGMRLMEVLRLTVKDVDFGYRQIVVRNAKRAKDRVVPLPEATVDPLSQGRRLRGRNRRESRLSFSPALVRDTLARERLRHSYGAGAPRPCGRLNNNDLHARLEQRRPRRSQPSGQLTRFVRRRERRRR